MEFNNYIIVTIPGCHNCEIIKKRFPHMATIELSDVTNSKEAMDIKRYLHNNKLYQFPIILNKSLTGHVQIGDLL